MNKRSLIMMCSIFAVLLLLFPSAVSAVGEEYVTFYISSSPSGAMAVLQSSGEQIMTPNSFTIHTGTQYWGQPTTITVSMPGYEVYYYPIAVSDFKPGTTQYIDAVLTPQYRDGYLSISSSPSGASAYVDGSYVGTTPVEMSVNAGYHSVSLQMYGYSGWSGSATVSAGQTSYLSGTLYPDTPVINTAALSLTSSPTGAEVYIDNQYYGSTPLYNSDIPAGMHTISVSAYGYYDWVESASFGAGQTVELYAVLNPNVNPPDPTVPVPVPTNSPMPVAGLFAGLGAAAVILAGRKF